MQIPALIEENHISLCKKQHTFRANCRPSRTAILKGSVSFFRSALARFLAANKSVRICGRSPFRTLACNSRKKICFMKFEKEPDKAERYYHNNNYNNTYVNNNYNKNNSNLTIFWFKVK